MWGSISTAYFSGKIWPTSIGTPHQIDLNRSSGQSTASECIATSEVQPHLRVAICQTRSGSNMGKKKRKKNSLSLSLSSLLISLSSLSFLSVSICLCPLSPLSLFLSTYIHIHRYAPRNIPGYLEKRNFPPFSRL